MLKFDNEKLILFINRPWKPFDPDRATNKEALVVRTFSNAKDVQPKSYKEDVNVLSSDNVDGGAESDNVDSNGNYIINTDEQGQKVAENVKEIDENSNQDKLLPMNGEAVDGNYVSTIDPILQENIEFLPNLSDADLILSPADLEHQGKIVDDHEFSVICPLCKQNNEMQCCAHLDYNLDHNLVGGKEHHKEKKSIENQSNKETKSEQNDIIDNQSELENMEDDLKDQHKDQNGYVKNVPEQEEIVANENNLSTTSLIVDESKSPSTEETPKSSEYQENSERQSNWKRILVVLPIVMKSLRRILLPVTIKKMNKLKNLMMNPNPLLMQKH